MKVGVPKETAEGERRVALVPEVVRKLAAKELEVVVEAGAGAERACSPTSAFSRRRGDGRRRRLGRGRHRQGRAARRGGDREARLQQRADRLPRPADQPADGAARWPPRARPPSPWRPSRASRAPSRWTRCPPSPTSRATSAALLGAQSTRPLLPDADDRRGHDPAGEGPRPRGRRRRAAGDRHRAPPRRAGHRLRRAAAVGRAGASRSAPRCWTSGRRGRRGRGRLRPRADRRGEGRSSSRR